MAKALPNPTFTIPMMMENGGGGGGGGGGDFCLKLPEGCIADILALTGPRGACRLALVASTFRSAAESDAVWERFLPADYKDILARAVLDFNSPPPASKKGLYLWLSDHPLLIDGGTKSFNLEKSSGRKCYMLAARDLAIVWGDTPTYWRWTPLPDSRFLEVAELVEVCWLEIRGKISTRILSPNTTYAAFLVFKSTAGTHGFEYLPAEVAMGISGCEHKTTAYLDPVSGQGHQNQIVPMGIGPFRRHTLRRHVAQHREGDNQYPKVREDGWLEVELGEYFNEGGEERELEMSVMEVRGGNWKSGLIIQGIDIRPKVDC
ncbi:putative F-box protein PP2-B12 isoform X3 [Diospyros lotus]|uniref:putative F-box protein PP2-B12 isoform X2 n=1 Tax=Diospyros lotus TaxID=55363 RepID=UPI0022581301|nr:putative F-box protein PP2-B12 isoform X2 [Diospyros lotus]XP_052170330.1 putative F-box protein PP2-B12 isoform X3 [Diospyros lotus]